MEGKIGREVKIGDETDEVAGCIGYVYFNEELQQKIESVVYSRGHDAYDDETDECRLLVDLFHLFLICVAKLGIVGE